MPEFPLVLATALTAASVFADLDQAVVVEIALAPSPTVQDPFPASWAPEVAAGVALFEPPPMSWAPEIVQEAGASSSGDPTPKSWAPEHVDASGTPTVRRS